MSSHAAYPASSPRPRKSPSRDAPRFHSRAHLFRVPRSPTPSIPAGAPQTPGTRRPPAPATPSLHLVSLDPPAPPPSHRPPPLPARRSRVDSPPQATPPPSSLPASSPPAPAKPSAGLPPTPSH